VPLSEHEQRLLEQIEQALYAEDPKFASSVRSARPRSRTRTLLALAVVGAIAGLAVVMVGLTKNIIALGVVGFVLIVVSCVVAASALRGPKPTGPVSLSGRAAGSRGNSKPTGLRSRMEDRMRRRFDEN
jgi:uncharacterized membrane protein